MTTLLAIVSHLKHQQRLIESTQYEVPDDDIHTLAFTVQSYLKSGWASL